MIASPPINTRYVKVEEIFKLKDNKYSLFDQYLKMDQTVEDLEDSRLSATMRIVIFSLRDVTSPTEIGWTQDLFPLLPIVKFNDNRQVIPPDTEKIEIIFPKNDSESNIAYFDRLFKQIAIYFSNAIMMRSMARDFFNLTPTDESDRSDLEIYQYLLENFSKTFNLYIGFVEGNHRLVASTLAIRYLTLQEEFFSTISRRTYLLQDVPTLIHLYMDTEDFCKQMQRKSEAVLQ